MDEVEVNIVKLQLLQGSVDSFSDMTVSLIVQLGCDKYILSLFS